MLCCVSVRQTLQGRKLFKRKVGMTHEINLSQTTLSDVEPRLILFHFCGQPKPGAGKLDLCASTDSARTEDIRILSGPFVPPEALEACGESTELDERRVFPTMK